MKKNIFIIAIILASGLISGYVAYIATEYLIKGSMQNKEKYVYYDIDVSDMLHNYHNDSILSNYLYEPTYKGKIENEYIAYQFSRVIFCNIYGKENIDKKKPFIITLCNNNIWVVEAIIKNSGKRTMFIEKATGRVIKLKSL